MSPAMRSKIAEEIRADQAGRVAAMSADERVELAFALGERAIEDYVRNFGGSRAQAVQALRRAAAAGRRPSACMGDSTDDPPRSGR